MAKVAEDSLKQYMKGGVMDNEHKKYLEKIRNDSKHSEHENKCKCFVLYFLRKIFKLLSPNL